VDNQHSLTFAVFHRTGRAMSAADFERRVDFALITLSTKCGMQGKEWILVLWKVGQG